MWRFILITFGFLGWSFYELSDGADFIPEIAATPVETQPLKTIVADVPTPIVAQEPQATLARLNLPDTTSATTSARFASARDTTQRVKVTLARGTPTPQDSATSQQDVDTDKAVILTRPEPDTAAEILPPIDLRRVLKNRVNMREGPSTDFAVVIKLAKGAEVEMLYAPGDGWVELRVIETGQVGWMADWLVTAAN